jgi:hypothetical protein
VPALRRFFQIGSLRTTLEPFIEFDCHRCKELALFNSISQMVTVEATVGISGRPDRNRRHGLAYGVYDLSGNALGGFRAGLGLFEANIKVPQSLLF